YFIHFLVVFPLLGIIETPKPLPESITKSVLEKIKSKANEENKQEV
ncbi:MAG: cytochrome b, partial [Rhodobiaceae bacterium]|nr:cytochrome b [Rhodobiaceae bacterium]